MKPRVVLGKSKRGFSKRKNECYYLPAMHAFEARAGKGMKKYCLILLKSPFGGFRGLISQL
jgi:hypothetical protein